MIFMGSSFSKYIQRALKRGDAMLDDSYGNRVSTNSIEATMSYNVGVHQFLGAEPGVEDSFRAAISADPNLSLIHI